MTLPSRRVELLDDAAKDALVEEVRARIAVATLACQHSETPQALPEALRAMLAGLSFVVEELHAQQREHRAEAAQAEDMARRAVPDNMREVVRGGLEKGAVSAGVARSAPTDGRATTGGPAPMASSSREALDAALKDPETRRGLRQYDPPMGMATVRVRGNMPPWRAKELRRLKFSFNEREGEWVVLCPKHLLEELSAELCRIGVEPRVQEAV